MVSTPKPPDPVATASAQSSANIDTALLTNQINQTNQVGPWGSTSYNQTGSSSYTDSFGKTHQIPQYTQTTQYAPAQQHIFDQTTAAQSNMSELANQQSATMKDYLAKPFSFNNQSAADWSYDLAQSRIAPQQQQATKALESQLINRGLHPGTAAWDSEMTRNSNANTDQNNQLALNGRQQAFNEQLTTRSQPINELSALMSGSQVGSPTQGYGGATPQSQVAGVDYSGLVQQNYQNKLQASQAGLGGLFGLAGSLGSAAIMASDRRVKQDVSRVGTLDNGLPVYAYRYVWGGPMQIGVMAQDVERVRPEAVVEVGGIKHVDYGQAVAA